MGQDERRQDYIQLHEDVAYIKATVDNLSEVLSGNGGPGLVQRVGSLEKWRSWITGIGTAVMTGLGMLLGLKKD